MSELVKLEKLRKMRGISWENLAKNLPISGNALRIAFTRKSVDDVYLEEIRKVLKYEQSVQTKEFNDSGQKFQKPIRDVVIELVERQDEALEDLLFNEFLEKMLYKKLNELKESKS